MPRRKKGVKHPIGRRPKKKVVKKDVSLPMNEEENEDRKLWSNWEAEKAVLHDACFSPCTPISPM